jgi:hypothetical protein
VDPVPGNNTDTENTTIASQTPRIGIAKNLLSVVPSGNGVFTVTIRLTLENFGNILLNNLELFDDIETQFAGFNPGGFIATSNGALATNPNWDGTASSNILQAAQSLAVGGTDSVDISFQVTSLATTARVANIAIANGTPPGGTPVTDTSTDGLNPDPNGDRNPDELVPTLVTFNNPLLGIAKDLLSVTANGNDAFIVTIRLTLENFGNVILNSLEIFDDIITQFAGLNPTSFIAISNGALTTNPNWNGTATSNILQDSQSLAVGGTDSVNISFQITPVATITNVANIAIANGTPPVGPPVTDTSTDGLNPDPNGDRLPDELEPTPVTFNNPLLGIAKDLLSVTANGSGAFIVTIRLTLENFGNVILNNIEIFDDIITQFAGLNPTSFIAISNGALTTNPNWNGTATSNILQGSQSLAAGGNDSVNISFQVTPGTTTSRVDNLVTARGTPPSGLPVTDISTDGLDPDPNNNRIPDEQRPTPIIVPPDPTENPVIGMAKSVNSLVDNGIGTFNVQFTLTLENLGDVPLNNLVVVDDIVGQFTGLNPINFTATDGSLLANSSWDGLATTNILQAGQSLVVGESRNVFIGFQVTPTEAVTVSNLAFTTGDSPTGTPVTDTSTNGLDPDPNGDRNPNENVPTPVLFNTPAIPTLNIWALGSLFTLLCLLGGRITRRRITITR